MKYILPQFRPQKRIVALAGHYGSGKSECAVSLAMALTTENPMPYSSLALIDLDIANPYFRSRERKDLLEGAGISVYGDCFWGPVTAELPALGAAVRGPLENENCRCVLDLGGNDSGAKVVRQFTKYFFPGQYELLAVVNRSRPETTEVSDALMHLQAIEQATGLLFTGIINNTHLLMDTTPAVIAAGLPLCRALSERMHIPLLCHGYPAALVNPEELSAMLPAGEALLPLGLYLRASYLDRHFTPVSSIGKEFSI